MSAVPTIDGPAIDEPTIGGPSIGGPSIGESLKAASALLTAVSESPRLDAELLLGAALGIARAQLIARSDARLAEPIQERFAMLIERRAAGVPIAYLTGRREFWSLELEVSPAVLVPRPETETLVEQALELLPATAACSVLDLGTGSGAIAIALAHERPRARIVAIDCSVEALAMARRNAARLVPGRIDTRQGDWFEPVAQERFDLIVANPPYIAAGDPALAALAAEPELALIAGPSGLEALGAIIEAAPQHLQSGGALLLEHGADQAHAVARLLHVRGFISIRTYADGAGRPRIARGILPSHSSQIARNIP